MSLNDDPSLIFCIMAARSVRALSLMREHVASAYFCRGGRALGDTYFEGDASEDSNAASSLELAELAGEEAKPSAGGNGEEAKPSAEGKGEEATLSPEENGDGVKPSPEGNANAE